MPQIAIIDDNLEQSATLKRALEHYLRQNNSALSVITKFPFKVVGDYFSFIDQNDVCVLILDERLNDQSFNDEGPVGYKGNELVAVIRKRLKDFPVFMVTAHADDEDVIASFGEFEYIIGRELFIEEGNKFTPIIIRSAQRYLDLNLVELSEYDRLVKMVASGSNDAEMLGKLKALQVKLELPISNFDDRKFWLEGYSAHITELEKIKDELTDKLNGK